MTTKEFAQRIQDLVNNELEHFKAVDGANFAIELNGDDQAVVCTGKSPDQNFLLHIVKIAGYEKPKRKARK